jgi:hypothetical protein
MLIFLDAGLAFLATPKTGTTAIEAALKRRADLVFQRTRKHMPARRFAKAVGPFVSETFGSKLETVALMREPTEQLRSWYRYRTRDDKIGTPQSTRGVSFETFAMDVIADSPPEYARINGQFRFLTLEGALIVTHLFAYSDMEAFRKFMEARLGQPLEFTRQNMSPDVEAPLSAEGAARLTAARAAEYALYRRLIENGGYLHTPQAPF